MVSASAVPSLRDEVTAILTVANRPHMGLQKMATGKHWPAIRSIDLQWVDEWLTRDDFLFQNSQDHDLFAVHYAIKKRLTTPLGVLGTKSRG